MEPTAILQATIWEDSDVTELARITINGTPITQASIGAGGAITRKIFDTDSNTPNVAIGSTTLVFDDGNTVFDELQTDARWDSVEDSLGYNFRNRIPGTNFPTGDHVYRVEYQFTGANNEKFPVVYKHHAQNLRGS